MLAVALFAGCKDKDGVSGPAGGQPIAAIAPPQGTAWTDSVGETEEGGYRIGNPNAPVKLVEYASLSCPHCAEFSKEAAASLKDNYVKSGRVSWEFRPFLLFPTDVAVTLLARCQGPGPFFQMVDQLYADQESWMGRIRSMPEAQVQAIFALPPQQSLPKATAAMGLEPFFRMRGVPEGRINSCLADQKALEALARIKDRGTSEFNVQGTPTFFINGDKAEAQAWQGLELELKKALGE
jgi:protein-disulfide isomerase